MWETAIKGSVHDKQEHIPPPGPAQLYCASGTFTHTLHCTDFVPLMVKAINKSSFIEADNLGSFEPLWTHVRRISATPPSCSNSKMHWPPPGVLVPCSTPTLCSSASGLGEVWQWWDFQCYLFVNKEICTVSSQPCEMELTSSRPACGNKILFQA